MPQTLELDYYYGNEAEQYSFYRIPKILFTDQRFKPVSTEAKVLYGLLLDRMSLSVKNRWLDENRRVYIIYTISDIMETLGCAEQKANKLLGELDDVKGVGLIVRKRRGLGKPNVIYVKNFLDKSQIQNCENHKSGDVKITTQELLKSQTSNTDLSNTDLNDTDLSIHPSSFPTTSKAEKQKVVMDEMDSIENYRELIRENVEYDILLERYPYDKEQIDGIMDLMLETVCATGATVRIGKQDYPREVVKSRMLKLNDSHIEYVMDCLHENTTKVHNIRAYLLTALFNAPTTISSYYTALVSHDMANGFGSG